MHQEPNLHKLGFIESTSCTDQGTINPPRALAERVTVVVSCVCVSVCMSIRTCYSGSTRN